MLKRIFDIIMAVLLISLFLPLIIIIAIVLKLHYGSVFFRQWRPGLHTQPFQIIKFKTMHDAIDVNGEQLSDKKRLTSFGRFLRKTSLDELPELWNVLKGDMSLVGPRPLLMEYLPLYSSEQKKRHNVRPGLTGWAQINGRNLISWETKFAYDLWYIQHQTFWLDLKILMLTALKVLKREGINTAGEATASKFLGT